MKTIGRYSILLFVLSVVVPSCGSNDKKLAEATGRADSLQAVVEQMKTPTQQQLDEFYECNRACVRQLIVDLLDCREHFPNPNDTARQDCETEAWKKYRKCFEDCDRKTR
jgi:hypothetical protein